MEQQTRGSPSTPGLITIAPGVLVTIARLSSLGVEGVAGVAPLPGGVNRLFRRGVEGVRIEVDENEVEVDLHLLLTAGSNVRDVSRRVQAEVARAIEHMVGMKVRRIDVHVEDIDYAAATG